MDSYESALKPLHNKISYRISPFPAPLLQLFKYSKVGCAGLLTKALVRRRRDLGEGTREGDLGEETRRRGPGEGDQEDSN